MTTFSQLSRSGDYFVPFRNRVSDYNIPDIEQVNLNGQRFYITPSGSRYPSMTTLLSSLGKEELEKWRKRVGPEEAAAVSRKAGRRGTTLHALTEHYLLNQQDAFNKTYRSAMPDAQASWSPIRDALSANMQEFRALECRLYSDTLRLSGTADCIGVWKGKLAVLDFKTSLKKKKREWIDGYFMQTDGYGQMWEERTGEVPELCVIVMTTDGLREAQIFEEPFGQSLKKLKELRFEFYKKNGF